MHCVLFSQEGHAFLKHPRLEAGLTQNQVADSLDVTPGYIGNVENTRTLNRIIHSPNRTYIMFTEYHIKSKLLHRIMAAVYPGQAPFPTNNPSLIYGIQHTNEISPHDHIQIALN